MKQLLDIIPVIVFFIVYKVQDIFQATRALMIATAIVLLIGWIWQRKLEKMSLFTFLLIMIFGTLTLKFHNADFIKWKVTVLYSLFGFILLGSQWLLKKPLIQSMLGKELKLSEQHWRTLNVAWALFFLFCALLNIYVAFWLSQDTWMNFKTFGLTGLTLLFTILSGVYIWRTLPENRA